MMMMMMISGDEDLKKSSNGAHSFRILAVFFITQDSIDSKLRRKTNELMVEVRAVALIRIDFQL